MVSKVYMDYAAATPLDPQVIDAMLPYFRDKFGNPSSLHSTGSEPRKALNEAREKVAKLVAAKSTEIYFTSGGTESNNLAIKGVAYRNRDKGDHIITTGIEHISIVNICKDLAKDGFKITHLPVDKYGTVDPTKVEAEISKNTIIITLAYANGEIGTIQPIKEIGKIAREHGVLLHVDSVPSVHQVPINVQEENIDLLSISSNDMYGPKGMGALYVKQGTKIEPIMQGGGQEMGLRSGSENIAEIVGFGKAAELARERMSDDSAHMIRLRDELIKEVLSNVPESYLNGHPKSRLPNNVHLRFSGVEGESLLLNLDEKGVSAATGSACSSKTLEPSHVLIGIGLNEVEAHGSLLFTLGRENREEEVDYVLQVIPEVVTRLRSLSPLWGKKIDLEKWKKDMEHRGHEH
jgi:cysteine desulfurase